MKSYLRGLEAEFGESSNAIRLELNRMEEAGLLDAETEGNRKVFHANTKHPLFNDLHSIVCKHIGLDSIIEEIAEKVGDLKRVYLTGSFAKGQDSKIIDLLLVAENIDKNYLNTLVEKAEDLINRKIRLIIIKSEEESSFLKNEVCFIVWEGN
ncbi:nucleotidyltransferase domain-containing protein [Ancylomarina sp. 16SWW S1-10-2]|uniref:nucleotidyltransferase domain-containing protein n=1 Tax=Ancylomarina sp. 16SWW S1-10-2 TaxID=2499681 RepID=UPI001E5410E9|nr:nucleotidyltransferase domain-containing protein [Ancylomarina sp. 16SWW S1-10-2]